MRRAHAQLALGLALLAGGLATARAAVNKVHLEIWGLREGDEAQIDEVPVTVRGGPPRPFLGDPTADDAPVLTEVMPGQRQVSLQRTAGPGAPCATEVFTITVEGTQKTAIVLTPADAARCSLPELPPRH